MIDTTKDMSECYAREVEREDCQVLTSCAGQNVVSDGSDVQVGGLRDRERLRRRSTPVREGFERGEARTGRRRATSECVPRKR